MRLRLLKSAANKAGAEAQAAAVAALAAAAATAAVTAGNGDKKKDHLLEVILFFAYSPWIGLRVITFNYLMKLLA